MCDCPPLFCLYIVVLPFHFPTLECLMPMKQFELELQRERERGEDKEILSEGDELGGVDTECVAQCHESWVIAQAVDSFGGGVRWCREPRQTCRSRMAS